jgi:hypothetical protein
MHLILLLLLCSTLFGNTLSETALSSSSANFDGNTLHLSGNVVLDHGLGTMRAQEADLERQSSGKDFPFSSIRLRKEVLLSLKESAKLQCESADLDFAALKGVLTAPTDGKVIYTDALKRKKGEKTELQLLSSSVELTLSPIGHDGKKTDYTVDSILAKQDVTIEYAKNFFLEAGSALYRKVDATAKEFQGWITAYPKDEQTPCTLTHGQDKIDADSIEIDLLRSRLLLAHPRGTFFSPLLPGQKEAISFSCDTLMWDQAKNQLLLSGAVKIDEKILGSLTTTGEIELVQTGDKKGSFLKTIRSKGETTMRYDDKDGETEHTLVCHGPFNLDRQRLVATLESPEVEGSVPESLQIFYQTQAIAVFADKARLEYAKVDGSVQPVALSLSGHIRLLSHDPKKPKRCALADRISYAPSTRTLILAADPGKKVLFSDDAKSLRMSAQEIHITQDENTLQEVVKGVGAVQFTLTDDEHLRLKKIFGQ